MNKNLSAFPPQKKKIGVRTLKKKHKNGMETLKLPQIGVEIFGDTLPKTNSLPLKNGGWETTFLLGLSLFSEANC